jgi:sporulation integral membrane protein YtvI
MLIVFVAAVLIVKDLPSFHKRYEHNDFYKDMHKVTEKLSDAGIAYLRSQLIIMMIVAVICVLGLTLIKNDYAVLLGLGIAIMDALPILGSGIIFIPWAIIMLMNGNIFTAAILVTTYLLCQIIREVLEPKLIGNSIGIKPIFTLIAMYVGVKLFSIAGFFLGPIGLVIIITIYKVINDKAQNKINMQGIYDEE